VNKSYNLDFSCLITGIHDKTDSILYSGYASGNLPSGKSAQNPRQNILPYRLNTLSFHFAAPFFEGQEKMLFSYKLEGQDDDWSPWQPDARAVLSNLFEGDYVFRVKARNAYGQESSESSYHFSILPPWYRTKGAFLVYILLLIGFIYTGIRLNSRRLIEKNKKLEAIILERTQEIKQKNIVLEHQKQEILDSINYAQRIQKAVLTEEELIKSWLGEHFILFRPKDIVSGDFFWACRKEHYVCFCVADCTGHGVPGAFMSMLCISFLNEVVLKEGLGQTNQILDRLRQMIIESLKQKGVEGEQKDGMDINLCILNTQTNELQYSGANNNLYIVRHKLKPPVTCGKTMELGEHVLYELKSDNMPIAIHLNMPAFRECTVSVEQGDRLYLFTDGFADQFGGPAENGHGKKFLSKAFKNILLETAHLSMEIQQEKLEKKLDDWMAYTNPETGKPYEQVDDICVMGVRVW
jgi:serine phosphatase RsbU (regulator of sigma subunit)